jgi:hypothetical protein
MQVPMGGGSKSLSRRVMESLAIVMAVAVVSDVSWRILSSLMPILLTLLCVCVVFWLLLRYVPR